MKKRLLALVLLGALAVGTVLSGCASSSSSASSQSQSAHETSSAKDELVFVNYRDIRDLNPHLYAGEMYAQSMLYDTLVSITDDGYEGCLAESWEISDDGKIYTFKIRDGVKFSDGDGMRCECDFSKL